jgi:hypothetical protein
MLLVDIDPGCYTTPTSSQYNKTIGGLYAAGNINQACIIIEIDSNGAPGLVFSPPPKSVNIARGQSSRRNVWITTQVTLIDETLLQFLNTGIQGSFMFQLANYIERGVIRALDQATGTPRTAYRLMYYATYASWTDLGPGTLP